jgi:hypothetical protein
VADYNSLSYSLPGPVSDATQLLLSECFGRDAKRQSDSSDEELSSGTDGETNTGSGDAEEWVEFYGVRLQLSLTAGVSVRCCKVLIGWENSLQIKQLSVGLDFKFSPCCECCMLFSSG